MLRELMKDGYGNPGNKNKQLISNNNFKNINTVTLREKKNNYNNYYSNDNNVNINSAFKNTAKFGGLNSNGVYNSI